MRKKGVLKKIKSDALYKSEEEIINSYAVLILTNSDS